MNQGRSSRQTFLGPKAERTIATTRVGVVGLGGGGSHIVQQLAHVGFRHLTLCDPDYVEESNLNRLIGATAADVAAKTTKLEVATRLAKGLQSDAQIVGLAKPWEEVAEPLRHVDLIFGCLDGFAVRRDLEAFARRFFIPLIDIGLDVHIGASGKPQMAGQVILSMPGHLCMHCMGFLNSVVLAREAERYGDAGIRPQVVWANGMLASAAVGIALELLTDWTRSAHAPMYLEYDGNLNTLAPPARLAYLPSTLCPHFAPDQSGLPSFEAL